MEYRVINLGLSDEEATQQLNLLAAQGWELMQVVALPGFAVASAGGQQTGMVKSTLYAVLRKTVPAGATPL